MASPDLLACHVCGDRVPDGQHECWALKKMQEHPVISCARCGFQMREGGICVRWTCGA